MEISHENHISCSQHAIEQLPYHSTSLSLKSSSHDTYLTNPIIFNFDENMNTISYNQIKNDDAQNESQSAYDSNHPYPPNVNQWNPYMLGPKTLKELREKSKSLKDLPKSLNVGIYFNRNRPSWAVTYWEGKSRKYRHFFIPDLSQQTIEIVLKAAIRLRDMISATRGQGSQLPLPVLGGYGALDYNDDPPRDTSTKSQYSSTPAVSTDSPQHFALHPSATSHSFSPIIQFPALGIPSSIQSPDSTQTKYKHEPHNFYSNQSSNFQVTGHNLNDTNVGITNALIDQSTNNSSHSSHHILHTSTNPLNYNLNSDINNFTNQYNNLDHLNAGNHFTFSQIMDPYDLTTYNTLPYLRPQGLFPLSYPFSVETNPHLSKNISNPSQLSTVFMMQGHHPCTNTSQNLPAIQYIPINNRNDILNFPSPNLSTPTPYRFPEHFQLDYSNTNSIELPAQNEQALQNEKISLSKRGRKRSNSRNNRDSNSTVSSVTSNKVPKMVRSSEDSSSGSNEENFSTYPIQYDCNYLARDCTTTQ